MNIKHILVAGLVALGLGLAAIIPGMNDGQQVVSPAKDSPTAWALASGNAGAGGGDVRADVGGRGGIGGDVRADAGAPALAGASKPGVINTIAGGPAGGIELRADAGASGDFEAEVAAPRFSVAGRKPGAAGSSGV